MAGLDRVIVVTGASSGIGRAIALSLAKPGLHMILHASQNLVGLADTARDCMACGALVRAWVQNFEDANEFRKGVDYCFAWKDRVDVWVHAAGADVLTGSNRDRSFAEKLERLWKIDVQGTILISRMVATRMQQQTPATLELGIPMLPTIIHVGWDQAETGIEGDSGQYFSATKSAVMAFTRSLAQSVQGRVRVNGVAPGWIQTAWGQSAPTEWDTRAKSESCLGRWGTPQDVAGVVEFLTSPQASFVNGQVIAINGGRQMHPIDTQSLT